MRIGGVAILAVLLLSACGDSRQAVSTQASPSSPSPAASQISPPPVPASESMRSETVPEKSKETARSEFDESDLKAALLQGRDIGPGWTSGQAVGTDAEGTWPCGEEPGPTPDAQAGRSMMHNGVPVTQVTVTLLAFATASDAIGFLREVRDNVRDCKDEPAEVPGVDGAEMIFSEIELFERSYDPGTDSEVLCVAVRQFRDGQPIADGVGVFYRLKDVVGSMVLTAPAARDTAMDQVAVTVASRQIERAATELGRGK